MQIKLWGKAIMRVSILQIMVNHMLDIGVKESVSALEPIFIGLLADYLAINRRNPSLTFLALAINAHHKTTSSSSQL